MRKFISEGDTVEIDPENWRASKCPVCSSPVEIYVRKLHERVGYCAGGEGAVQVQYQCGLVIENKYYPHIKIFKVKEICHNNAEHAKTLKKRQAFVEYINKCIDNGDVDEEFKEKARDRFRYFTAYDFIPKIVY